jgi:hypothetical protein
VEHHREEQQAGSLLTKFDRSTGSIQYVGQLPEKQDKELNFVTS